MIDELERGKYSCGSRNFADSVFARLLMLSAVLLVTASTARAQEKSGVEVQAQARTHVPVLKPKPMPVTKPVENATAPDTGDANGKPPEGRLTNRQRALLAGAVLLALVIMVGVAMIAFIIILGQRARRLAAGQLPTAAQPDPLWYLRRGPGDVVTEVDKPEE